MDWKRAVAAAGPAGSEPWSSSAVELSWTTPLHRRMCSWRAVAVAAAHRNIRVPSRRRRPCWPSIVAVWGAAREMGPSCHSQCVQGMMVRVWKSSLYNLKKEKQGWAYAVQKKKEFLDYLSGLVLLVRRAAALMLFSLFLTFNNIQELLVLINRKRPQFPTEPVRGRRHQDAHEPAQAVQIRGTHRDALSTTSSSETRQIGRDATDKSNNGTGVHTEQVEMQPSRIIERRNA